MLNDELGKSSKFSESLFYQVEISQHDKDHDYTYREVDKRIRKVVGHHIDSIHL